MNTTPDTAPETAPAKESQPDLQSRTDHANTIVRRYTLGALAPGLVPVPLVDLAALTGIQLTMVGHLAKIYDQKFSRQLVISIISSLVGNAAGVAASPALASVLKIIPGIGSVYGGATVATLGAAVTYALGKVFQMHFEAGGNFLNFNPEQMRDYFAEQLAEGKKVAAQLQSSKP